MIINVGSSPLAGVLIHVLVVARILLILIPEIRPSYISPSLRHSIPEVDFDVLQFLLLLPQSYHIHIY